MISFPSYKTIIDRVRADVSSLIPELDPAGLFGSFIRAITDSCGGRHYDNVLLLQQLEKEVFPQTASAESLEQWAAYEALSRNPAVSSSGHITVSGTINTTIPLSTAFQSINNLSFVTTSVDTITTVVNSITTLTRSGTTATAYCSDAHNLATHTNITIAGAVETDYNGTFEVTVISATVFSYTLTATPTTPATGTITATGDYACVQVESVSAGNDQNIEPGATFNISDIVTGVDSESYVGIDGITGGADAETDSELLTRVMSSRANPVANFSVGSITRDVLSVSGVTRVLVKRVTPYVGAVTVYFVRDNDDDIIPDAGEVQTVRDKLLLTLPAQTEETDLIVEAPTAVTTNYVFSGLTPNTTTMQDAVLANLQAFYEDNADFETDITEDAYRSAIIETIDPVTGDPLSSFTLTSPTGDISITSGQIGVLGTVTNP